MRPPRLYDVAVVGGGIIGCATARLLKLQYPGMHIVLLEKEPILAGHQSGRNSGVIHAGIYYKPGSLKAQLCVRGMQLMYEFLDLQEVPYKRVGKLVVATKRTELARLEELFKQALENGCEVAMVPGEWITDYEPNCQGLGAIWSPMTGIVDFAEVTRRLAAEFQVRGGDVLTNFHLSSITESGMPDYSLRLSDKSNWDIFCSKVITCTGLQADRVAQLTGCAPEPRIVPFRGQYLILEKSQLVSTNIYPVPDPSLPFLGVHFTPRMSGEVWLGPNALPALGREDYNRVSWQGIEESLRCRGTMKLLGKHIPFGLKELYKAVWVGAQVQELRRFVPLLERDSVRRGSHGIRAQAVDVEGNLVDDFLLDTGEGNLAKRVLHLRNALSPAATSSLAISELLLNVAKERLSF